MTRKNFSFLSIFLFLLFLYGTSYSLLQKQYDDRGNLNKSLGGVWSLPDVALLAISGEFKGLIADYLVLEAGAQLGTDIRRSHDGGIRVAKKEHNWTQIHRIFVASQILDPSFAQTFLLAQGWLPWDAGMIEEANNILQTASDNRPWDWQPLRIMAFNYYFFNNQPAVAGRLFQEAALRPQAPPFLSIVGSRLAQKGGGTEAALALMESVLADKTSKDQGYEDMVDRYHALEGTLSLEQAVARFQQNYGRAPVDVEELLSSSSIRVAPANPYNLPYCIDLSGKVYFDNPKCREVSMETE